MTPSAIRAATTLERAAWVRSMVTEIRRLPVNDREQFFSDRRNLAAAESYLRRALEALLDLGRHVAARGFGEGVVEYKEIPRSLERLGVIDAGASERFVRLAGYRNRMVHFYQEITAQELFHICVAELDDVEAVLDSVLTWLRSHPDMVEGSLD